jgi:hypothetical protein
MGRIKILNKGARPCAPTIHIFCKLLMLYIHKELVYYQISIEMT